MGLNVPGLIATLGFYVAVLATGVWASKRSKAKASTGTVTEVALLGGRSINLAVGIFTMTATWVGGGFILGVAEAVYSPNKGLLWGLMPLYYSVSFVIGGLVFAKPMREKKYVTMMDPFQIKYGKPVAVLMVIPAIVVDMLWVACTLMALGGTISTILDLPYAYSVILSAAVAIIYTLLGGLYSVAYTDVIQLILIFVALWLCVPFILLNPIPLDISITAFNHTYQPPWIGHLQTQDIWRWLDDSLVLSIGALGFQCFHQRTLSAATAAKAQITCFAAAMMILILGIPSVLIGAVAVSTDWNQTDYGAPSPYERGEAYGILPICLQYLSPSYVSIFGIAAVAAAVMSSTDSALLSSTSMFSTNIYKNIRTQASDREILWVIRIAVVVTGMVGTALTFLNNSILGFWVLGADVGYCVLLPQLICVLFCPASNGYGAVVAYFLGTLLRLLSGEPLLGLPPVIHFPGGEIVDGVYVQQAPVRTIAMLFTLVSILFFSYLSTQLFHHGIMPKALDFLRINRVMTPRMGQARRKAEGNRLMMSLSCPSTVKESEVEETAQL
ncbi:high affinity choline transporter 1-like isoform X1 [Alosa sapidissima]|uniref:high affinity choline transporter 1-like isoform X1 n=1 Tax=Alosa sapidissima TaxID=34773 RepID=UPI001C096F50|nr:high affinity choline transporter 1-like isoform X1 [Alosa sapidissima]